MNLHMLDVNFPKDSLKFAMHLNELSSEISKYALQGASYKDCIAISNNVINQIKGILEHKTKLIIGSEVLSS